jgi:transcriptional regulator with XRE-family HTH domain
MVIGNRLKELRESKELSQGDIEKRTGLLRCYISRVENGHTVPAVSTLEKMARALEVPMYRQFHDGEAPASLRKLKSVNNDEWGSTGGEAVYLSKLRRLLAKMEPHDQQLLLHMAPKSRKRLAPNRLSIPSDFTEHLCIRHARTAHQRLVGATLFRMRSDSRAGGRRGVAPTQQFPCNAVTIERVKLISPKEPYRDAAIGHFQILSAA